MHSIRIRIYVPSINCLNPCTEFSLSPPGGGLLPLWPNRGTSESENWIRGAKNIKENERTGGARKILDANLRKLSDSLTGVLLNSSEKDSHTVLASLLCEMLALLLYDCV